MAQEAFRPIFESSLAGTSVPGVAADVAAQPRSRQMRVASRVIFGLAIVLLIGSVALGAYRQSNQGEIYPSVQVAGIGLGGMSRQEATDAVTEQAVLLERTRAHFEYGSQRWAPTLQELGITVNVDQTVDQAYAFGREGSPSNRLSAVVNSASGTTYLPLQTAMDSSTFEAYLDQIDLDLGLIPHNAELVIEGTTASIIPEANGTITDRLQMQELVLTSLEQLAAPTTKLRTIDQMPTIYVADLESARTLVEQSLSTAVPVTLGKAKWTINPEDLGAFVVTVPTENGYEATLDQDALTAWLSEVFATEVNQDPVDAGVAWDGEKIVAVSYSQTGIRMRPASFAEGVTASFLTDHLPVEIPVSVIEPTISENNLDALGITTRLAAGTSSFSGSDDARAANIIVGSDLLNGVLIPPGETFSFNHSIGVISEDLGFVEAQVVNGERIGRDIGGGICQVSTTVFRAVLYAGLPITEWNPHRYRLSFYELDGWTVGLDASILQPEGDPFGGGDFKFVNNTGSWILMESFIDGETAAVVLYGPDLGYTVQVSEPTIGEPIPPTKDIEVIDNELEPFSVVQSEYAQEGVETSYTRTVFDADGNVVLADTWDTYFYPRGNVYKVSPDMVGLSPAAGNTESE